MVQKIEQQQQQCQQQSASNGEKRSSSLLLRATRHVNDECNEIAPTININKHSRIINESNLICVHSVAGTGSQRSGAHTLADYILCAAWLIS